MLKVKSLKVMLKVNYELSTLHQFVSNLIIESTSIATMLVVRLDVSFCGINRCMPNNREELNRYNICIRLVCHHSANGEKLDGYDSGSASVCPVGLRLADRYESGSLC